MKNFLKMVAIWTLGPVLVAVGLGFILGNSRAKKKFEKGEFRVGADGKTTAVKPPPAQPQQQAQQQPPPQQGQQTA